MAALDLAEAERTSLELAARRTKASKDLPADIDDFSGRTREVDELVAAFTGTTNVVAVVSVAGMGGVGKTTLAVHGAVLLSERFPDGVLSVALRGHGGGEPADPLEVLQRLLRALGTREEEIPDELDHAAARYRSALADRRVLILLDDAANSAQVIPLVPGVGGSAALITTRKQLAGLAGLRQLRLDVLSDAEALDLLGAVVGARRVEVDRESALKVARLCGHLPLALRIAGGYLSGHPRQSLDQLATELENSRPQVLSADGGGVRASIDLSLRALKADPRPVAQIAAQIFPVVALLGEDDFALRAAAAALQLPLHKVEDSLEHLVDVSLLETPELNHYRMHDLVKEVGRELAEATLGQAGIDAVRSRVLDHYLSLLWRIEELGEPGGMSDNWREPEWSLAAKDLDEDAAVELLDADRANLVAAVRAAARGSRAERLTVVRMAAGMNNFGPLRKRWSEWRAVLEAGAGAVGEFDDPVAAGMIHFDLGLVYDELNEFERGAEQLVRAVAAARAIGEEPFEVAALVNLAHALEQANRLPEARASAVEALSHQPDERMASWIELVLGMIAGKEKDLAGQRSAFERSLEFFRTIEAPPQAMAMRYRIIAESLVASGEYAQADAAFRQARAHFDDEDEQLNIAALLDQFGNLLVTTGQLDEAAQVLAEGFDLAVRHELWDVEAGIRVGLGRRFEALGSTDQARAEWLRALAIYERNGAAAADGVRKLLGQ